ncbi:MAG TPA: PH domain-containing protein [Longilinea sp.]|nr:PH domain-containing protein [Longilinea sp.]
MNQFTQDGIAAMKAGDKTRAQQLLLAALKENEDDLPAWLWLSGAVESDTDRLECLQQVLRIDPAHVLAAKGVAQLKARGVQLSEPAAEPPFAETVTTGLEPDTRVEPVAKDNLAATEAAFEEQVPLEPETVTTVSSLTEPEVEEPREKTQPLKIDEDERPEQRPSEKIILKTKPSIVPVLLVGILIALAFVALVSLLFPKLDAISSLDPTILFMAILVILALIIGAIAVRVMQQLFTSYILTNRRLIVEDSLVSRAQKSLLLDKIQGISYRQNFLERIFGLGTVMLAANGESGPIQLHDIKNYLDLAERIEATVGTKPKE